MSPHYQQRKDPQSTQLWRYSLDSGVVAITRAPDEDTAWNNAAAVAYALNTGIASVALCGSQGEEVAA